MKNIVRKPAYPFRDRYLITLCDDAIPLGFPLVGRQSPVIFLCLFYTNLEKCGALTHRSKESTSQAEVRAVFINCKSDELAAAGSRDADQVARFERQELYHHGTLRECRKKFALTVKLSYEPGRSTGEEYIPIEHVFDEPSKKRVRLLNPYVLRLRRDAPVQAYQLRNVETVTGILTTTDSLTSEEIRRNNKLNRPLRDKGQFTQEGIRPQNVETQGGIVTSHRGRDLRQMANNAVNDSLWQNFAPADVNLEEGPHRTKRHEHNIVIEEDTNTMTPNNLMADSNVREYNPDDSSLKRMRDTTPKDEDYEINERQDSRNTKNCNTVAKDYSVDNEKDFTLYEIGDADLWHSVHVQLFEKKSDPDGKTIWNDITKGEVASVGTQYPEWVGEELVVSYKQLEWTDRNHYTLPKTSLYLLAPKKFSEQDSFSDEINANDNSKDFLVVPVEDIEIEDDENIPGATKRDASYLLTGNKTELEERKRRRVLVRISRAWTGDRDNMSLVYKATKDYLTMPHRQPLCAQIDLEAQADGNQLVRVGSSGRISTLVSDSTRVTRAVITVHAANTGLAAANFRIIAKDCGPTISSVDGGGIVAGPLLVPPMHSRRFKLDIPYEIPATAVLCSVAMVNDEDESVAVRDLIIKKNDQCFCVWHCDCVCLGDDLKLLCREMTPSKLTSSGVTGREQTRHVRSVCYTDDVTLDLSVLIIGVILGLLALGFAKACLGLVFRCIGSYGLDWLVQMPRHIDRYHEPWLRSRPVQYDCEGWPVHPDTGKRTVRCISMPMEFLLNTIFFVTVPFAMFFNSLSTKCKKCPKNTDSNCRSSSAHILQHCNSRDLQDAVKGSRRRRRKATAREWMTPGAKLLSTNLWDESIPWRNVDTIMQPLLHQPCYEPAGAEEGPSSCADSDQEDTKYVLTQMKKSKDSLTRSQRKSNNCISGTAAVGNQ